jgi:hypothetical protein
VGEHCPVPGPRVEAHAQIVPSPVCEEKPMAGGMSCRASTDPLGRHCLLLQASGR